MSARELTYELKRLGTLANFHARANMRDIAHEDGVSFLEYPKFEVFGGEESGYSAEYLSRGNATARGEAIESSIRQIYRKPPFQ